MEDESYKIIKKSLPKEWVIREFNRPDYGIDLVIEIFDIINDEVSETLGEFIYVQVKSLNNINITTKKIHPVNNVAKYKWLEDKSESMNINVVKYVYDTNSIHTIQALGASVSVLLFLVDIASQDVYFLCLNDYIDKVLLPKKPNYASQGSVTLTIPAINNIKNEYISQLALKFYGKRAKLLAAFSKFSYQKNELLYAFKFKEFPIITYREINERKENFDQESLREQIVFFIDQIIGLDIWNFKGWLPLPMAKYQLIELRKEVLDDKTALEVILEKTMLNWSQLTNLGRMYEDICREWFLPKFISFLTSYSAVSEIIKS